MADSSPPPEIEVFPGSRVKPLEDKDVGFIVKRTYAILAQIGIGGPADWLRSRFDELGTKARSDGRVIFPRSVVEKALARAAHHAALPGFVEQNGLQIGGGYVHIGTGGTAIEVLESDTHQFRESTKLLVTFGAMSSFGSEPILRSGWRSQRSSPAPRDDPGQTRPTYSGCSS